MRPPSAAGLRTRLGTVRRDCVLLGNRAVGRLEVRRRRQEAFGGGGGLRRTGGLEIGGPSAIFRSGKQLPVYDVVSAYDAANFAASTIWQGDVEATRRPRREGRRGSRQPATVIVPHRDFTFDHRREITPLAHLLEDERRATTEDDLTHIPRSSLTTTRGTTTSRGTRRRSPSAAGPTCTIGHCTTTFSTRERPWMW